jgi:hypothetical protein
LHFAVNGRKNAFGYFRAGTGNELQAAKQQQQLNEQRFTGMMTILYLLLFQERTPH